MSVGWSIRLGGLARPFEWALAEVEGACASMTPARPTRPDACLRAYPDQFGDWKGLQGKANLHKTDQG